MDHRRKISIKILTALMAEPHSLHHYVQQYGQGNEAYYNQLILTLLRHYGELDAYISSHIERSLKPSLKIKLMPILLIGACEILFLNHPPFAVVNEMVNIAKSGKLRPYAKLVNHILRRISEEERGIYDKALNIAPFIRQKWRAEFGEGKCDEIADNLCLPPALDIALKHPHQSQDWAKQLGADLLAKGHVRLDKTADVTKLAGFEDGAWWVQNLAASLPVFLLGDVKNMKVLDLCAAPGGKTMQLAAGGAKVKAIDSDKTRLMRLKDNLGRTKLAADCEIFDCLMNKWPSQHDYDAVLLDAPCSATGTMRRHPEIGLRFRHYDDSHLVLMLNDLHAQQYDMIKNAITQLKPDGLMVFAVCSLMADETIAHYHRLKKHGDELGVMINQIDKNELQPFGNHLDYDEKLLEETGLLRLFPTIHDGFFIMRIKKLR